MRRPRRILIIRTGGVGDFVLSLPVIHSLATAWPDADLEILGRPAIASLAQSQVRRITSIDDHRFARLFAEAPLDPSDPAAAYLVGFDLVVTFLGIPESAFGSRLQSLVPKAVFVSPPTGAKHAVIHFLEQLRNAGIEPAANLVPQIGLLNEHRVEGKRILERLLGPLGASRPIIVHPGSGGRQKNWPPHRFAQVVQLLRQSQRAVVLLQGEADEAAVRAVLNDLNNDEVPVLENAPLVHVAGAIAGSRLLVGNDSGISHLAAAVGTPVVCLFGPTDPEVWRPLGEPVRILTFDEATPQRVYAEGIRLAKE